MTPDRHLGSVICIAYFVVLAHACVNVCVHVIVRCLVLIIPMY